MSFTINYKGTDSRGINYIYACPSCGHEQHECHGAQESPTVSCQSCETIINKKPACPSLDADHHESMLSHNIGWEQ